jgi:hypothetical protein
MMISFPQTQLKDRRVYAKKVHARLRIHLKLDQIVWKTMSAYLSDHCGDERYWDKKCQPYLNLVAEHYQLARFSSRPLKHYQQHVEKLARQSPQRPPSPKHARDLLTLIETWYWREYP